MAPQQLFLFMKNAAFLLSFTLCSAALSYGQQRIQVIPQPVSVKETTGSFSITNATVIRIDKNEATKHVASWLNQFLQKVTGFNSAVVSAASRSNTISLSINPSPDETIGNEGYTLSVKPNGVVIAANKGAGLFYGIQTLIQMLPKEIESVKQVNNVEWSLPCVTISDYPRFGWRGLMLDVSRHFFTVEEVKKLIDEMARFKFNLLHWHLTDDNGWRVEIKSLPNLTRIGAWRVPHTGTWKQQATPQPGDVASYGGFYTQEQIKEVVRYAAERNVDILPEVDVPGHSLAAIASYPYLSCTKRQYRVSQSYPAEDNAFCLGNDSTYAFLDNVFGELAQLFPFEYVHIGGDECEMSYWQKCPVCQKKSRDENLKKGEELQSYFAKRVEKIVESKGKQVIGWDEILDGGLAPNAAVMSWRGSDGGIAAAKQQHNVVMSPNDVVYLDLYQGEPLAEPHTYGMSRLKHVYTFEPVPNGVDSKYILGGQGNLWTEAIPTFTHVEYMLWPRSFAIAEALWSPRESRNWNDFVKRTEYHFQRFNVADINYAASMYDAIVTRVKNSDNEIQIKLDTEVEGLDLYYTWDNTFPNHHSPEYKSGEVLWAPRSATLFRVITYRKGKPIGKMITIPVKDIVEYGKLD